MKRAIIGFPAPLPSALPPVAPSNGSDYWRALLGGGGEEEEGFNHSKNDLLLAHTALALRTLVCQRDAPAYRESTPHLSEVVGGEPAALHPLDICTSQVDLEHGDAEDYLDDQDRGEEAD